jgi:hypothetical protein
MSHVHRNEEAEQIMRDLKALTGGMSPEELRGAFACLLTGFNEHGVATRNVDLTVATGTLAQLANALFAETEVSHDACDALIALVGRMDRVNRP